MEDDHKLYEPRSKRSMLPLGYIYDKRIRHLDVPDLRSIADRSWSITQDEVSFSRPAFFLHGQVERIIDTMYTGDVCTEIQGGVKEIQRAARAYLIKDAVLIDGGVYKAGACSWLGPRRHHLPRCRIDNEIGRGAAYSSYNGNAFFGMWLLDDCATYRLAEREGAPININSLPSKHMLEYENWLGMNPMRLGNAYIREVILYDDLFQTTDKRLRCRDNSSRLRAKVNCDPHPGVFILRRATGARRILNNELALAEFLRVRRGYRIVDITRSSVPEILAACAGARVVVGVEGSHLVHGMMVLEPGCSVLTLQPPDRFCTCIKRVADPEGQNFGFVIGRRSGQGFVVDPGEVERTLDLFPPP